MKSDLPVLSGALPLAPDHDYKGLGYPVRAMLLFAAALALAVVWLVLTVSRGVTWTLTVVIAVVALSLVSWFTHRLTRAGKQGAQVLAALGAATADIPVRLP